MQVDADLKSLERQFWDAIQHKDAVTAAGLTDSQCVVVGAQGVGNVDHTRLIKMLEQATYELTHYEIDDASFQIQKLTDDVAVIAYRVREDLVVNDKAESLEAFDASVWVRRGDKWLCALHTETLKGDPFGRSDIDRLSEAASEAG